MRENAAGTPTPRERLDAALSRLVDAVMVDDSTGARLAWLDAVALSVGRAGREAEIWAEQERVRAARLPDDLDSEPSSYARRGGAT